MEKYNLPRPLIWHQTHIPIADIVLPIALQKTVRSKMVCHWKRLKSHRRNNASKFCGSSTNSRDTILSWTPWGQNLGQYEWVSCVYRVFISWSYIRTGLQRSTEHGRKHPGYQRVGNWNAYFGLQRALKRWNSLGVTERLSFGDIWTTNAIWAFA